MTARPIGFRESELRALTEFLSPELALEVARLQALEVEHLALVDELEQVRRQLHSSTVMVGELRQRAVRAENRLEDLVDVEEISKARREAHLIGDSFVRVTSHGRGQFTTHHVPAAMVKLWRPEARPRRSRTW